MTSPIFRNPPWRIESVVHKLTETVDWGLTANNISETWLKTKGKGVKVAVLDTGADLTHPDLKDAIILSKDFTNSPFGAQDRNGHGTHTSGTIAARQNNIGVVGVAPESSLLIGKVLGDDGSGSGNQVAQGINWAIDNKADIISMSLGSPQNDPNIFNAAQNALAKGILIICAAGNDGTNNSVNYPGKYTCAIAAYDKNFSLAAFSSRGPEVICAGPGVNILSTFPVFMGGYATLSGTSMATPFVAGVVALAQSIKRFTDESDLKDHLKLTSKDAGSPGFDQGFGWGLINPATLVIAPVVVPPPIITPTPGTQVTSFIHNGYTYVITATKNA